MLRAESNQLQADAAGCGPGLAETPGASIFDKICAAVLISSREQVLGINGEIRSGYATRRFATRWTRAAAAEPWDLSQTAR